MGCRVLHVTALSRELDEVHAPVHAKVCVFVFGDLPRGASVCQ